MNNLPYVLGVDVSKDTLSLCLMKQESRSVLKQTCIPNTEQDIEGFLSALPSHTLDSLCVAVEPTNTYWYLVAHMARQHGCRVVSAPPRSTKKFLESVSPRVKNDRLDAKGIALYASSMDLNSCQPKAEAIRALDELLSLRRKVSGTIACYAQLAKPDGAGADIASRLLSSTKEHLLDLDGRLKEALKAFEPAKRLEKVPGFGPVVTAALTSRLTTINFKSSDAFVAYVGLDLKVRESGKYRGRRTLSRNGDAELRRLLYLAAQSTIRVKESPFAEIYQRHRSPERGLTSTEAICVVARKMARTAWSMVKYQTEYNPARVLVDAPV